MFEKTMMGIGFYSRQSFMIGWFLALAFILLWALLAAFLAVMWHRLVLRPAEVWPPVGCFVRYLWTAFALLTWATDSLMATFVSYALPLGLFFALAVVGNTLGAWIWMRLGLILPGAAVGDRSISMSKSWFETKDASISIAVMAILQSVLILLTEVLLAKISLIGLEFFLWPLPVILGLAALSALFHRFETPLTVAEG